MRRIKAPSQRRRGSWLAIATASILLATLLQDSASVFAVTNPVRPPARHPAAMRAPSVSGMPPPQQPKKLTLGEQPDRRTRHSSTRYNPDHTFTTTVSAQPVNYRVRTGGWKPIDNNLISSKESGYAFRNGANSFQMLFKDQLSDDYLGLVLDNQMVTMSLVGASRTRATIKGSSIDYPDALPHVDATYNMLADGMDEVLTLRDGRAPTDFQFLLKTPRGTTASEQPDGSWLFLLPGHAAGSFSLAAPVAYDSASRAGDRSQPHAGIWVQPRRDGFEVKLSLDPTWLKSSSRKFPVYLDPTFSIQPDAMNTSFDNTCAGCAVGSGYARLSLGNTKQCSVSGGVNHCWYAQDRVAMQFDLTAIPAGVSISNANLGLFWDQVCIGMTPTCDAGAQIEAHLMTAAWSPTSTASQLQFNGTPLSTFTALAASATPQWMTFDVSSTVSGWLAGSQPNYGLYLKMSNDGTSGTGGPEPPAAAYGVPAEAPELVVTYGGDSVSLSRPALLHSNGADLSWSQYTGPSGAPFQQYQVHRSVTPGFTPSAATLLTTTSDLSATTFRDSTAAPGGTFYYAVVANSSKSNEVKVTLPADGMATLFIQPGPSDGRDTYIYNESGATSCSNYGASPGLFAGADGTGVYRTLLQFDVHQLPANATGVTAQLGLWHSTQTQGQLARTLHAYPVTKSWQPGSGVDSTPTCTGDGATWYETTGGRGWTSQGGDFDASTPSSQVSIGSSDTAQWSTFDVSSIVGKWVSGQIADLGLLVKQDDESMVNGNSIGFDSADFTGTASLRPRLQLTYNDGSHAIAPTVVVMAPAAAATVSGSSVSLTAAVADDRYVREVQFFVDGTSVGTTTASPWSMSWDSTTVPNGAHTVSAAATDDAGNVSGPVNGGSFTVANNSPPTASVTAPSAGATVSGTVTVGATAQAAPGLSVSKVEFYADNSLFGTASGSPFTTSWNTLDPSLPAYDGSHALTAKVYDSSGVVVSSSSVPVTVANSAGTEFIAGLAAASAYPSSVTFDPSAATQQQYGVSITVTNNSGVSWSTVSLVPRWVAPDGTISNGSSTSLGTMAPGANTTMTELVSAPALAQGVDQAQFLLRFDLFDASTGAFFADHGNQPVQNPVIVNRALQVALGLEHYYQYTQDPVAAGITHMVNIANGNSILSWVPWTLPGQGLASVVELTYNSRENHSDSPMGNNWSLAISSLTRFGDPIEIHPTAADKIAGNANRFISFVDADGTPHTFTGQVASDGTVLWSEPPGVHLYLRQFSTTDTTRWWALTRPDRTTFLYNQQGFPTFVTDKNGNTIAFTLTSVANSDDPGGPGVHVTAVTDARGRAINLTYYDHASAKKPQVRGKVRSITDHDGHEIDFLYYDDGNLLRITQRGGQNPDGTVLPDRSWTFTYTTPSGSIPSCTSDPCYAPAIADSTSRLNPDSNTPSESTRLFSVIDPNGHETQFAYFQTTGALDRWKISGLTDRAGSQTTFAYDDTNLITTVAAPVNRVTKYAYSVSGQVTSITDPLGQTSSLQWSSDLQVVKVTEPNNASTSFSYNDNGDLTSTSDQLGNTTTLTYQSIQVDSNDVAGKWRPGRTTPHISQLSLKSDQLNHAWQFTYDTNGNLTQLLDPLGAKTTSTYNSNGTLATTTDPLSHTTSYSSYDSNGLPTTSVDPLGNTAQTTRDADGLTLWVQDPNHFGASGNDTCSYRDCFTYDAFNRLFSKSSPLSTVEARGQLIFTDLRYDPNDNLVATYSAHQGSSDSLSGAAVTTSAYDVMDRLTDTFAPPNDSQRQNEQTHFVYDAAGRTSEVVLPNGIGRSDQAFRIDYLYDGLDRLTAVKHYQVSLSQNPGTTLATLTAFYCYDSASNRTSVTSPAANLASIDCGSSTTPFTTRYQYDAARHLRQVTDPDGHVTKTDYDAAGNVTDSVDAVGNQTLYTYDSDNRLTKIQQPFDTSKSPIRYVTAEMTYDAAGNKLQDISTRAFDAAGGTAPFTSYVTSYQYDADNRLVRTALPTDASTPAAYLHRAYDPNGNLTMASLADPNSDPTKVPTAAKTVMTYWDLGWIMTSSDNVGPTLHFAYDASGRQTSRVPATTSGGLDSQKELDWSYYPDGSLATRKGFGGVASYLYDPDGSLLKANTDIGATDTQASPIFVTAGYDSLDRVVKVAQAPSASASTDTFSSFTYDLNGNVASSVQNAQEGSATKPGRTFFYDYDQANWLMDECDSSGTTLTGCHAGGSTANCTGSSTSVADQCMSEAFTAAGQESTRALLYGDGAGGWRTEQQTAWTYFANGKLATMTAQNGGGAVVEAHSMTYLDPSGVYLNGNQSLDHFKLQTPGSGSPCYSSSLTSCTTAYTYDARDRVTVSTTSNDASGASYSTSYKLKVSGDVHEQVNQANGVTTSDQIFTYNAADTGPRLDHITESVSARTTYYGYDALGNVQCVSTQPVTGLCTPTTGGTVSPNLVNLYVYDPLNRLGASHTYTGAGTNNQETDNSTYAHDPLDRVVSETESHNLNTSSSTTKTTTMLYIGLTSRLAEEDQNQGTATAPGNPIAVKAYAYDPFGHRIALTDTEFSNGTAQTPNTYAYGYNVQDSVSTLLDAGGNLRATYAYTPYGQADTAVGGGGTVNPLSLTQGDTDPNQPLNQYRFMAKRFDTGSRGLDTGARTYSVDTGRFFQQDTLYGPLGNLGLTLDPLTQNRYSLVGGNPLSFIEWDGHLPVGSGTAGADPSPTPAASIFASYGVYAPNGGSDQSDWRKYLNDPCTSNLFTYLIYCRPQVKTQAADGTEVSAELTQGQCPIGPELCIGITIHVANSSKQGSGDSGSGGGSGSLGGGAAAAAAALAAGTAAEEELQIEEEGAAAQAAAQGAQGRSAAMAAQVGEKVPYTETDLSQIAAMDRIQYNVGNGRNIAVAEYQVEVDGQVQTRYIAAVSQGTHSEKLIYNKLIEDGVDPRSVTRIYSELEPCSGQGMPNCSRLISQEFPNAQVTYSFDYGSTIESRRAGIVALKQAGQDLILTQMDLSLQYPAQPIEGFTP